MIIDLFKAIMLARIKLSYQEIKKAILEMNEEALTIDNLRSLKQFTPTEEELETIREYDGDAANLGNAEKFFLEISTIPNLAGRLDCMIFKRRFEHDLEDLKPVSHTNTIFVFVFCLLFFW